MWEEMASKIHTRLQHWKIHWPQNVLFYFISEIWKGQNHLRKLLILFRTEHIIKKE